MNRLKSINPVFIVLVLLLIAVAVLSPNFLQPTGYMNFLKRAAPIAILAVGQLFVINSGGFDLSAGALVTLTVIGSSILLDGDPSATWWVIGVMFAIGLSVGVVNALVVSYLKVPSIIATLGMMISLSGIALTWSGGAPRGYLPENFRLFGRLLIKDLPLIKILPVAVIVMVVVCLAFWWLMHRTNYGKQLVAMGDNPKSAQLAGVPLVRTRIIAFCMSSLSAIVAGILLGGFAGVSTDVGVGLELQAITAAVIGGASLNGGSGTILGAILGVILLSVVSSSLALLDVSVYWQDINRGSILLAAVTIDHLLNKKRS
jgi:ribose transport system permease protein